jgi:hypothetical protein
LEKNKTSPSGATLFPCYNEEFIPLLKKYEIDSELNISCNIYIAPPGLMIFITLDPGVKTPGYIPKPLRGKSRLRLS